MNDITSTIRALSDQRIAGLLAAPLTALAAYSIVGPFPFDGYAFGFLSSTAHFGYFVLSVHIGSFLIQTAASFIILTFIEGLLSRSAVLTAVTGFAFVTLGVFFVASGVPLNATAHPILFCGLASFAIGFSMLRPNTPGAT